MNEFFKQLKIQRWDDHRYYHHSRINQTLHLISAISFVVAYALLFKDPAAAALLAWLVSMTTRQSGHFFFEPLGYDEVNQATQETKEEIKVGYNLRRKIVLLTIWAGAPVALWIDPTMVGLFEPATGLEGFARHTGMLWLYIGIGGLLFRTVHLFFIRSPAWGLAWCCKILLDPIHNVQEYWASPIALMRGQRLDPLQGHKQ